MRCARRWGCLALRPCAADLGARRGGGRGGSARTPCHSHDEQLVAASIDVLDVASAEPTSAAGTSTSFATALNATKSGEADGSSVFQNVRELLSWAAKGLALVVGSALVLGPFARQRGEVLGLARARRWLPAILGGLRPRGGGSLQ